MSERRAVLFSTPWTHPADGWAIASRAYARAMHAGGVDVVLRDWQRQSGAIDREVFAEVAEIVADQRPARLALHVFSSTLASARHMTVLDVMTKNPEPQAYYCVFERRHVEPELVEKLNRLAGIWVQCRMNERVLREAGVRNVTLIPYPFFDDDPHLQLDKPDREPRHFYYVGRFEPRKAPERLIQAFLRAFRPGESRLTIKTSPIQHSAEYPSAFRVVDDELYEDEVRANGWQPDNVWQDLRVVSGMLSKEEMLQIHAEGDVYVSPSRGEGLELPAWAAKLSGRRLIATASGGPEDFLDEVDIRIPATGLVPADPSYPWGEGATYIDYDLDALVAALQRARSEPACGNRTWPGWEKHRATKVAEKLRKWVHSLL